MATCRMRYLSLKTDYSVYENIRYPAPGYGEATPKEIERARRLLADARAAEIKRPPSSQRS